MNKNSPGVITGLVLGIVCLTLGLGLYLWAPGFTGFFSRPSAQPVIPVWTLLLLLALVNFVYAGISNFLQRKLGQSVEKSSKPERK